MPQFVESYYLLNNRGAKEVFSFIEKKPVIKIELADEYPVPQYSNIIENTFYSDDELMSFLESNPSYDYNIYWENENKDSIIKQFSIHFTDDGKVIFGVAIKGGELDSEDSIEFFVEVKKCLKCTTACITSNESPPTNSIEFIDFCNERFKPI
jgi:hypothetical protein